MTIAQNRKDFLLFFRNSFNRSSCVETSFLISISSRVSVFRSAESGIRSFSFFSSFAINNNWWLIKKKILNVLTDSFIQFFDSFIHVIDLLSYCAIVSQVHRYFEDNKIFAWKTFSKMLSPAGSSTRFRAFFKAWKNLNMENAHLTIVTSLNIILNKSQCF